jgi:hypothetical protein
LGKCIGQRVGEDYDKRKVAGIVWEIVALSKIVKEFFCLLLFPKCNEILLCFLLGSL